MSRVSLLDRAPANQAVRLRLFCFPFAGGGASFYTGWEPGLPAGVAVQAVQFPGRENLLRESPISDLMLLVEAAAAAIKPVTTFPYAFFGHSLGALVAFELVRKFRREGVTAPSALVVSAHGAPQCPRDYPPLYQQPDERFLRAVAVRYPGGIPDAFLRNAELVRLFSPGRCGPITAPWPSTGIGTILPYHARSPRAGEKRTTMFPWRRWHVGMSRRPEHFDYTRTRGTISTSAHSTTACWPICLGLWDRPRECRRYGGC